MSRFLRKIIISFTLCVSVWAAGLFWFIGQIPTLPSDDNRPADVIVVLTGGGGRIEYGLQLLSEGLGKKMFITGVHENISVESVLRQASPSVREHLSPQAAHSIILGHDAWNTIGNAEETAYWLKLDGSKSIRLITANYHMPRALQEFQTTLHGITIIPSPSFPEDFNIQFWWQEESRNLVFSEYHKFIASKLRHWILSVTRTV